MHIGFLTSDLSTDNGWANYSLSLIRALHQRGIRTTVITAHNSPKVEFDIIPILPAITPPERASLFKSLRLIPRVKSLLADCDLIHATAEPYAPLAHAIAGKRPYGVTAHGSYINLPVMRRFPAGQLYRRAFRNAHLICVSQYTAQVARQIMPDTHPTVINNGVDSTRFLSPPALPEAKTRPTIITSGGIKPRKGTLPLVEAMAIVREQVPDVQCLVMGSRNEQSGYFQKVQDAITRLNLRDTIKLMGFVDDDLLLAWMAAADVFVLPSINDGWRFEGFGLVVLEASASGTAVIGTDNCGVADAIQHNHTGLIVSQANIAEALPRAILDLLTHPEKAKAMGQAGREYTRTQSWDHVASQVLDVYGSMR